MGLTLALIAFGIEVLYLGWTLWFLTKEDKKELKGEKKWKKRN